MNEKITYKQAKEQAQAIHETWCGLKGIFHSPICKIGALDGFYQGLGVPYTPQDGPYNLGTPEFDAYFLGEQLAFEHLDLLDELAGNASD